MSLHVFMSCLCLVYLPPVVHIALIPQDHLLHISTRVLLNVPDPVLDVVEALLVCDVVDEHDSHGPPVVGRRDGPEALLAGRVPDLELDFLSVEFDGADFEIDAWKWEIKCFK